MRCSPRRAVAAALVVASAAPGCAEETIHPAPRRSDPRPCSLPIEEPHVVDVAVSGGTAFALYSDGSAKCWGDNSGGRCTVPEWPGIWRHPGLANRVSCATKIIPAAYGGFAMHPDGTVSMWSSFPPLLAPTDDPTAGDGIPVRVSALDGAKLIAAGGPILAILADDTAVSWDPGSDDIPVFTIRPVDGLPKVKHVSGSGGACAVTLEGGEVWCWGNNIAGQLGDGTTQDRLEPGPVTGLRGAVKVACGEVFACALLEDATVWCWGTDWRGQLGDGGEAFLWNGPWDTFSTVPVQVAGLPPIKDIFVDSIACALDRHATLWCWGPNRDREISKPSSSAVTAPVPADNMSSVVDVEVGVALCALKADGVVWCQGNQTYTGRSADMGLFGPGPVPLEQAWDYKALASSPQE